MRPLFRVLVFPDVGVLIPGATQAINQSYAAYLKSTAGSVASTAAAAPGKAAEFVPHEIGAGGVKLRLKNPPEEEGEGGGGGGGEEEGGKEEGGQE